jgi:hypothetical protein
MRLRYLHRIAAICVGSFVLLHLGNHLALLASWDAHIALMHTLRRLYRFPLVEALLFVAVAVQILSGLRLAWQRRNLKNTVWQRLQMASGLYLAFFFINHIGATLFTRFATVLDTNIHFASAGFHVPPFQYFFAPYYLLAVSAFFAHIACLLRSVQQRRGNLTSHPWLPVLMLLLGPLLGGFIVAAQAGVLYPIAVQESYLQTFRAFFLR